MRPSGSSKLPPYLAIRHLLDSAGGVEEALAILRGQPLASSRTFVLCDRDRALYVEALDGELRVESPDGGGTVVAADIPVPD